MSMLSNFKIGTRLGLGFGFILVFVIIITSIALSELKALSVLNEVVIHDDVSRLDKAHEINAEAQAAALKLLQILSTQERTDRMPLYKEMDKHNAVFRKLFKVFSDDKTDGINYDSLIESRNNYEQAFQETVEFVEYDREMAFDNYLKSTHPTLNDFLSKINRFVVKQKLILDQKHLLSKEESRKVSDIVLILSITLILFMIVISISITRSIVRPLAETLKSAQEIAEGNIIQSSSVQRKDEIGELNTAFDKMSINLNSLFSDLEQSRDEAIEATKIKSQFLSTMSHEIRTPMNGVLGMAQLLETTSLTLEQQEYLEAISQSGNSLLSIINNVLDFSKLEMDKVELEIIEFDLEDVCQQCLILVSNSHTDIDLNIDKQKRVEFILDYSPDCPRTVIGDPSRVRQVLLNILGNAIKFTSEGYIRCGVSLCENESGQSKIYLEIEDTGIGIKAELIASLFSEFSQGDSSTTRKYGGTGLGLAITEKLTTLMGGEIGIDSIDGEGSTFWIKGMLSPSGKTKIEQEMTLADIPILVVDDNLQILKIIRQNLNAMNMDVSIEVDPTQVIDTLQQASDNARPFSIVIIDQNMPIINGLELGKLIKESTFYKELKLLTFSSFGNKGDVDEYAAAGFDAYLNKICRYEVLQSILVRMLTSQDTDPILTQYSLLDDEQSFFENKQTLTGSVLVVEDNVTNQLITKKMLAELGLEVEVVNNGQEALYAFELKRYDLIFMDCRMPVMDGYSASTAMRQIEVENNYQTVPIIALTANASIVDRKKCLESGMSDVVSKPFRQKDLLEALSLWLPK